MDSTPNTYPEGSYNWVRFFPKRPRGRRVETFIGTNTFLPTSQLSMFNVTPYLYINDGYQEAFIRRYLNP